MHNSINAYFFIVLGWVIYFLLHSVLATSRVKTLFEKRLGMGTRHYRVFYSVLAIMGFIVLMFYSGSISSDYIIPKKGFVRYLSLMLATFGIIIIKKSFKNYSLRGFLGISDENDRLITSGILQYVRHPLYSGTILMIIGYWLFSPNYTTLVSCLCMLLYLPVGIYYEEKKLIAIYGQEYIEYKKKVPSLIPFFKRSEF